MNDTEFKLKLQAAHAAKDDGAWELCKLALEAREAHYPQWDVKIAAFERRSPRTVRDWARAAEFRQNIIGPMGDLTYSFYLVAARHLDRIHVSDVIQLMETWAVTPGATLEAFAAQLHDMAPGGADADSELLSGKLRRWHSEILGEIDRAPAQLRDALHLAADVLADAAIAGADDDGGARVMEIWSARETTLYLERHPADKPRFVALTGRAWAGVSRVVVRANRENRK